MARPTSEHPTDLELQILKILWERSPLPVREIRMALGEAGRRLAHTSVITTLNIMVRKGSLRRKKEGNRFLFEPRVKREEISERMLDDLVHRVFDGSAAAVMLSLFQRSEVDSDELRELRRLVNRKMKERSP